MTNNSIKRKVKKFQPIACFRISGEEMKRNRAQFERFLKERGVTKKVEDMSASEHVAWIDKWGAHMQKNRKIF